MSDLTSEVTGLFLIFVIPARTNKVPDIISAFIIFSQNLKEKQTVSHRFQMVNRCSSGSI